MLFLHKFKTMDIQEYIKQINEQFKTNDAREHSYRPMLQQLLNDMLPDFIVTNEPARVSCGAPDYIITSKRNQMPVFYIEAKDINDSDLDGRNQHKEQFTRYKAGLDNIIFTDYLDFHLYEHGEWVKNVRIGEIQGNNIRLIKENVSEFNEIVSHIADTKPAAISSASKLAAQMAARARTLAQTIKQAFKLAEEDEDAARRNQQLQVQLDAFRRVLINDLTPDGFADIYAQTVAYGMFAARLHDDTPENFSRIEAANLIPKSNPFLRQIFQDIAGFDLDNRIAWVVDDLVSIFLATDIEKVMKTYSNNGLHHDPMIHFYEDFLSAYDPSLRKAKGVWYTPQPVVQFIVRAVDEILQKDFGLADGLADCSMIEKEVVNETYSKGEKKMLKKQVHRVQILDPATGTGTFLAEAVNQIYDKFHGMQGMWQGYVTEHLLPRLHGFELLMASYAVAHIKMDMLLKETGFVQSPSDQQRLKIYLTNSLEEFHPDTGTLWSAWLSNEATEANQIKRDCPVMVMMGNPPYSGESQNKGEWIMRLMDSYKKEPGGTMPLQERNPKWINDDYVKFIRLAQDYIDRTGEGVIGFINPHGFLDNPTFRGMRWNLLKTFDKIYTINLHGNGNKKETCPDGSADENIFDIKQGVSINIFVRTGVKGKNELGKVFYADLYGRREEKYLYLTETPLSKVAYQELKTIEPMYLFIPIDKEMEALYNRGIKVSELFHTLSVGIVTAKDDILIGMTKQDLSKQFCSFDSRPFESSLIKKISYRPFDVRYLYYDCDLIERPRDKVTKHFIYKNIGLITARSNKSETCDHFYISENMSEAKCGERTTQSCIIPLYLYQDEPSDKMPNINPSEWQKFNDAIGRETTPEELLAYIYGVLHSPSYRERYKEFLKVDFPRIPLPESAEEFNRKAELGQQLIDIHLMKDTQTWKTSTTFPESGDQRIERNEYSEGKVWINNTQYFGNVPDIAWNFYIGGYQPAQKWLKDRKGRTLTFDEIKHYLHIIYALTETDRIMKEIG